MPSHVAKTVIEALVLLYLLWAVVLVLLTHGTRRSAPRRR